MDKFLVISEISKKQGYIFKTNKLKENIGASTIIEYITEELTKSKLKDVLKKDNITENIVNAGGGNSLFIVDTEQDAINFIKATTKEVLERFPGVEFFMTYYSFDYDKESIIKAIDEIYKMLNRKKSERKSVFRRKSYGIEEECVSTNMAANTYSKSEKAFLSSESLKKREWSKDEKLKTSKGTISRVINEYTEKGYTFTKDLNQLTTEKGENSYVAIVTLDGNKMGSKIENMKLISKRNEDKNNMKKNNDEYRNKLYKFSNNIKTYYEEAFKKVLDTIISNYEIVEKELNLNQRGKNKEKLMPIRPIILAGDDVCFICNAKIALESVNLFISELNKHSIEGEQINACAGICMLKSSYPFDRGYDIAENLCATAKAKIVDQKDASLVDFHICQGEISTSLSEMRERARINKNMNLNIKPLYINEDVYNSYKNFKYESNRIDNIFKQSKGKVRKLRDVFPISKEETRLFMNKNRITKYFNQGFGLNNVEYGFSQIDGQETCLYFDLIEVKDLFMNLKY